MFFLRHVLYRSFIFHLSQDSFEHGTAPDPSLIVAIAIEAMASFSGLGTPRLPPPHALPALPCRT